MNHKKFLARFRRAGHACLLLAAAAAILSITGCGKEPTPVREAEGSASAVVEPTPRTVPTSPEEAHASLAKALGDNRPELWFDALPPRYQAELNTTFQSFVNDADEKLWRRGLSALRKALRVLREKHDLVVSHPLLLDRADLEKNWDDVVALLATPLEGDLLELSHLRKSSVRELLAGPAAQMMTRYAAISKKSEIDPYGAFVARLQSQKAQLIRKDGAEAWLQITTPNEPSKEEKWVRVDGHWVPESLVLGWTRRMGAMRKTFGVGTPRKGERESNAEWKAAALARIEEWDRDLDEMLATEDPGTFHAKFSECILWPLLSSSMAATPDEAGPQAEEAGGVVTADALEAPAAPKGNAPAVTTSAFVVVKGALDAEQRDVWQKRLGDASDAPDFAICIPATQGMTTRFEVNPVGDVGAFAKRLSGVRVVSIDEKMRTVTIELK